ncbi:SRPBCC family protein [Streptomyces sp. NRRL F-2580]|uniref:SRPBCC family protein n=1 Tax=Streptomyces sp. NRRL F-2580 TaxID=1463841 RepID=UPI0007C46E28|nr:SRPBCC family protein [Streptomyces sp. NRRL F-2580]
MGTLKDYWPVAELDAVRRLRVIARSTPGAGFAEQLIDAPLDQVWALASDLENQLPVMITDIRSFTVTSAVGEHLEARARSPLGLRTRFDVVMRPGWCLMQSRFVLGGMAAVAERDGTRFAFFGALRLPGTGPAGRALDPLMSALAARALRRFTDRLARPGAG